MDWTWGGGLNEDIQGELHKANCVTIMSDGSIDVGIIEQELVYLQYVSDGLPKVKMVDVVDLNDGHADGVVAGVDRGLGKICLSLKKFADGNSDFPNLVSQNYDGASVNMGSINGTAAKLRWKIPHAVAVHCVAYNLKLGILDS